jgi:hypothetical protein
LHNDAGLEAYMAAVEPPITLSLRGWNITARGLLTAAQFAQLFLL